MSNLKSCECLVLLCRERLTLPFQSVTKVISRAVEACFPRLFVPGGYACSAPLNKGLGLGLWVLQVPVKASCICIFAYTYMCAQYSRYNLGFTLPPHLSVNLHYGNLHTMIVHTCTISQVYITLDLSDLHICP